MIIIALILSIVTLLFVICLAVWVIFFHRWVLIELDKKFMLRPGEQLRIVELKFGSDVSVLRGDTKEPLDAICVLEYARVSKNGDRNE